MSVWAIPIDGSLVLLDVARDRVPEHRQIDVARPLVERWNPETTWIESTLQGTHLVRELVAEGWHLDDLKADKSKTLRAAPAARRLDGGRLWFPAEHELRDEFVKELKEFPNSAHDDMVDTLAYAALVAFAAHVPAGTDMTVPRAVPRPDPIARATDSKPIHYERQRW